MDICKVFYDNQIRVPSKLLADYQQLNYRSNHEIRIVVRNLLILTHTANYFRKLTFTP